MLDAYLSVCLRREDQRESLDKLACVLSELPPEDVQAFERAGSAKVAFPGCSNTEWLDRYDGTPLLEQALALEQEQLDLEALRIKEREASQSNQDLWVKEDLIQLRKRQLDLELAKRKAGLDKEAAPRAVKEWLAAKAAKDVDTQKAIQGAYAELKLNPRHLRDLGRGEEGLAMHMLGGQTPAGVPVPAGELVQKIYDPKGYVARGDLLQRVLVDKQRIVDAAKKTPEGKATFADMYGHERLGPNRFVSYHEYIKPENNFSYLDERHYGPRVGTRLRLGDRVAAVGRAAGLDVADAVDVNGVYNPGNIIRGKDGVKVIDFIPAGTHYLRGDPRDEQGFRVVKGMLLKDPELGAPQVGHGRETFNKADFFDKGKRFSGVKDPNASYEPGYGTAAWRALKAPLAVAALGGAGYLGYRAYKNHKDKKEKEEELAKAASAPLDGSKLAGVKLALNAPNGAGAAGALQSGVRTVGAGARTVASGVASFGGALNGAFGGIQGAMQAPTGRKLEGALRGGAGSAIGGSAGAAGGAALGTAIMPGIGTLAGGLIGGMMGSKAGYNVGMGNLAKQPPRGGM